MKKSEMSKNNINWWLIIGIIITIAVVVSLVTLNGKRDSNLKGELASLSGNSVNLINFSAPAQVRVGQSFQIGCDFGERLPCIAPTHTGGICSWIGWNGNSNVALFNCTANAVGLQNNTCNLFNYPADPRCVYKAIAIGTTNVFDASSGQCPKILRVMRIINSSAGYSNDVVELADLNFANTYRATLISEGRGIMSIDGIEYSVQYFGSASSENMYIIFSSPNIREQKVFRNAYIVLK